MLKGYWISGIRGLAKKSGLEIKILESSASRWYLKPWVCIRTPGK